MGQKIIQKILHTSFGSKNHQNQSELSLKGVIEIENFYLLRQSSPKSCQVIYWLWRQQGSSGEGGGEGGLKIVKMPKRESKRESKCFGPKRIRAIL